MRTKRKGAKRVVPVAILLAVLPLTSCGLFTKLLGINADCERYVEDLDFAISDRIVRGEWQGEVEDLPTAGDTSTLNLDLTASLLERGRYGIEGSFALDGEAPAMITGTVYGGCAEAYLGTAGTVETTSAGAELSPDSLPPSASLDAEVRDDAGTKLWHVTSHGPPFAGPLLQEGSLVLHVERLVGEAVRRTVILDRIETP